MVIQSGRKWRNRLFCWESKSLLMAALLISHRKAPLKIIFHFPKAGYISSLEGTLQHCRKNYQKHFQHGKSNPYKLLSWCFLPTNRAPPWSFQLEEFQNYISEGFLENPMFGRVNPRLGKQQPNTFNANATEVRCFKIGSTSLNMTCFSCDSPWNLRKRQKQLHFWYGINGYFQTTPTSKRAIHTNAIIIVGSCAMEVPYHPPKSVELWIQSSPSRTSIQ